LADVLITWAEVIVRVMMMTSAQVVETKRLENVIETLVNAIKNSDDQLTFTGK